MSKDIAKELTYILTGMPIFFAFIAGILHPTVTVPVVPMAVFGVMPFLVTGAVIGSTLSMAVSLAVLAAAFSTAVGANLTYYYDDLPVAAATAILTLSTAAMSLLLSIHRIDRG